MTDHEPHYVPPVGEMIAATTYVHDEGHYHSWAQTHDHGKKAAPHTHQARQAHPDAEFKHHHATEDHERKT